MATLITVTTPITDTQMSLALLRGHEGLSQPFEYEVYLLSTVSTADFSTVLGGTIAITMTQPDDSSKQYLHGTVVEFAQEGNDLRPNTMYRARIRPAFWLLSMHSAYQIFQNKTVVQILEAVFSDQGFTAYKNSLTKTYTAQDYIVQYGETTLDFVCRLMEEAGIYYFFEHSASADTLVLADDASAHSAAPGTSTLKFTGGRSDMIGVDGSMEQRLVPASYKTYEYNFTTPSTSLTSTSGGEKPYQIAEYPGGYLTKSDGDTISSLRLTTLEAEAKVFHGHSRSSNLHAGVTFTLANHPRSDANASWLILRMSIQIQDGLYSNQFDAIPATSAFHPPRVTRKNRIAGAQTALVTGKAGEEIWTDAYGRVKVKFPWDGTAAKDETTSCWVRVAQVWAGKAWGSLFTPRMGQEVVVSFLNGDPEQPLIVGTVYNAEQTMPYTFPGDQTKSSIKTNSSKGGQGFNELRFEDKAGSEEVFLQAQKDLNINVVKGDHSITVAEGKETHTVKKTRDVTVTDKETHTNSSDYTQSVTGDFKQTLSGKSTVAVTGDEAHTNSANFKQDVSGNYTLNVTGNLTIKATGSVTIESGTGFTAKGGTTMAVSSGTDTSVKGGTTLALEGGVSAELKGAAMAAVKGGLVQIN